MPHLPWVRFFVSDWRGSAAVGSMDLAARGLYLELLVLQAAEGPFEWNPRALARQLRALPDELESAWPQVQRAFTQGPDGRWSNAKMAEEVELARGRADAASRAGKASARARKTGSSNARCNGRSTVVGTGRATERPTEIQPLRTQNSELREQSQNSEIPPSAGGSPDGSAAVVVTRSGRVSTRKAGTPQAELVEHWADAWLQTRGTAWADSKRDYILAAQVLSKAGGDLDEAKRRATRLLQEGEDEWIVRNASIELLSRRWNQLAVTVQRRSKADIAADENERTIQSFLAGGAS